MKLWIFLFCPLVVEERECFFLYTSGSAKGEGNVYERMNA